MDHKYVRGKCMSFHKSSGTGIKHKTRNLILSIECGDELDSQLTEFPEAYPPRNVVIGINPKTGKVYDITFLN